MKSWNHPACVYSWIAGAIISGCMLLLTGCTFHKFSALSGIPRRATGIDVSEYQHTVNWNAVAATGIEFAWTKATEGSINSINYSDGYLAADMAGATHAGILIGTYHFAHPEMDPGPAGAREEALLFITSAGAYMTAGYLRPVLDIEVEGNTCTSAWVNDFLNDVYQATGVTPIVYTYSNYAADYLNATVAHRNVWMADAPIEPDPKTGKPVISAFQHWNFWQYGQSDLAGINGIVDRDVANGTLAYVRNILIPAQCQLPGTTENATTAVWSGAGSNGRWSNAVNWSHAGGAAPWVPGDVAKFTDASQRTNNVVFDEGANGNHVVNVAQIDVAEANVPAVTIHGSDPMEFRTYLDPIYNNSRNTLTIKAPVEFFGTMGPSHDSSTNNIFVGPGNIILRGPVIFNDSQTQVVRDGFNDLIAIRDNPVHKLPGNVIIFGAVIHAPGTPPGYSNGFRFSNAGGYDDIISDNSSWTGGMYITNGAMLIVSAKGSTGTGAVTLDGTVRVNNNLQPAGIRGGIAGDGTVNGPVTVIGGGGVITAGGQLVHHYHAFISTTGNLTFSRGLDMNDRLVTFNFYFSGDRNSSLTIKHIFHLSRSGRVRFGGTPVTGTYHLFYYQKLLNAAALTNWTVTGPSGFHYHLINNAANRSIDIVISPLSAWPAR